MHLSVLVAAASVLGALPAFAQEDSDPLKVYTISAENIEASFIPYGARLTNLLVPDRNGNAQDVVAVGYDDPQGWVDDTLTDHTYAGSVLGRYANRIKNGTFELDGVTYEIPKNDNDVQTLHGGKIGYDQKNWTVTSQTENSITFTLLDVASEGFPGDVLTNATFTVGSVDGKPQLTTKSVSVSLTERTPIMLSNHNYWNLNGFKEATVLNNTYLHMPLSGRFIATDSILAPNGELGDVAADFDGSLDFRTRKLLGEHINSTGDMCGEGCHGYDHCFLVDREPDGPDSSSSSSPPDPDPLVHMLSLSSTTTGITMDVSTNQRAVQVYTCNWMGGNIPVKQSQIDRNEEEGVGGVENVLKYGCVAIEPQGWIDGINNPDWGQIPYQVFGPEDGEAVNWAEYTFGVEE
ncbi:hypothetical protein FQN55_008499 [Onygenales sp. PD_40]|nr:hypothetical protein FQN55_008499 [Onygenales sp. PD_40]KAK2792038.1 hypothetical protein FQN52_004148 [Onygenales sp. PD_12]KAK2804213.1 hypothetical protein FQN51_002302 [Onygenales sp. PD_10]